jgi:hypothetical protein
MCTYRFPDADYERSFYREMFGVELLHEEPEQDLAPADHEDVGIAETSVFQPDREAVAVG